MTTLQERIAKLMAETGKTVGDLAEIAGVSSSAVTQWKDGPTKSLKTAPAVKLAAATGFNAMWIATGAGEEKGGIPPIDTKASAPSEPTLAEALALVATHLNTLPDAQRLQAAQHLETLARAPDSQKALDTLLHALQAQPTAAPAVESRDFHPPVPPPTHLLKKPT